jgi:hypothetical protein
MFPEFVLGLGSDNKVTNAWDAQSEKVRLIILNASF